MIHDRPELIPDGYHIEWRVDPDWEAPSLLRACSFKALNVRTGWTRHHPPVPLELSRKGPAAVTQASEDRDRIVNAVSNLAERKRIRP